MKDGRLQTKLKFSEEEEKYEKSFHSLQEA